MNNLIDTNTAKNAMEAQTITDGFLASLTDEQCAKLAFASCEYDVINIMPLRIAYAIGASAYYYGAECKIFCSDRIANILFNRGFDYIRSQKETA